LFGDLRRHEWLSWARSWRGTKMHDIGCRRVLNRVFWMCWLNLAVNSGKLWCQTIAKERKQWQETLLMVMRALLVTLARMTQRVRVVLCRITVKFSVDSSTIVVHFPPKCIRGPATKSSMIFDSSKDGNQNQQQNPWCKQFILCTTRQAPENHGGTLRCLLPL
jgi:hypothetical protein